MKRTPSAIAATEPTGGSSTSLSSPLRIAATSSAAVAQAAASAASAKPGPTVATSRPPSAGPAKSPMPQAADTVACPSANRSTPTIDAIAPNVPASANTRAEPIANASGRIAASGGAPAIVHTGITAATAAWQACAESITVRRGKRSPTAPASRPKTTYGSTVSA